MLTPLLEVDEQSLCTPQNMVIKETQGFKPAEWRDPRNWRDRYELGARIECDTLTDFVRTPSGYPKRSGSINS